MGARKLKGFGWQRDTKDERDFKYRSHFLRIVSLPEKVDLRKQMSGVEDQLDIGSCVFNAVLSEAERQWKKGKIRKYYQASRLWLYYKCRELMVARGDIASVEEDSGAEIRDAIKLLADVGVPNESSWPYKPAKFAVKPPTSLDKKALPFRISKYYRLSSNAQIKEALSRGFTVAFGMLIYESFYDEKKGFIPDPKTNEEILGGHAMQIVGYDDKLQCFIVRNSWGTKWGDKGYCYISYSLIAAEADDMWCYEVIGHGEAAA